MQLSFEENNAQYAMNGKIMNMVIGKGSICPYNRIIEI